MTNTPISFLFTFDMTQADTHHLVQLIHNLIPPLKIDKTYDEQRP